MPKKTKRFIAILRVSKVNARSGESFMSVDQQAARCATVASQHDGKVTGTIESTDVSGHYATDTPEWRAAVDRVKAGEFNGIVFAYTDRFSRNAWTYGSYLQALKDADGEVWFADMPFLDYRTDEGRQLLHLLVGQHDSGWSTARTKGAENVKGMLARGVPNTVPYGYKRNRLHKEAPKVDPELDGKALVVDEPKAEAVKTIFRLRSTGAKWSVIIDQLEADAIPSPSGLPLWTTGTLANVISNQTYLGHVVFSGEVQVKHAHEAIVDPKTFQAAQSTATVIRHGRNATGLAGPFLHCPSCGGPLRVISGTSGVGSYGCRRSSGHGRCPRPVHINKARTDAWLDGTLRAVADGRIKLDVVEATRAQQQAEAALVAAADELHAFMIKASATDPYFEEAAAARQQAVQQAEQQVEAAAARATAAKDFPSSGVEWDKLSLGDKHAATRSIGIRVDVAPFEGGSKSASDVEARLSLA
jgi:hypothetical protein